MFSLQYLAYITHKIESKKSWIDSNNFVSQLNLMTKIKKEFKGKNDKNKIQNKHWPENIIQEIRIIKKI